MMSASYHIARSLLEKWIDVHYNFIGEIDLSPEYSKKTTA